MPLRLSDLRPVVPPERLVAELVPPPRFDRVSFASYLPDPAEPSQAAALAELRALGIELSTGTAAGAAVGAAGKAGGGRAAGTGRGWRRFTRPGTRGRPASGAAPRSVYLDGGYGVGKTHLLASLWHAVPGPAAFGTFVELTNLVGALGFAATVGALSGHQLVCIDEFELDDPGDTVLVSSLLSKLAAAGVTLAATSNTLPGRLGEGRFAAADFRREIQGLAGQFRTLRIDGADFRHRGLPGAPEPCDDAHVTACASRAGGASLDDFAALLDHLAGLHPSRYGALLDGVEVVCLRGVETVTDQNVALRLVVLADRLYDRDLPVVASGVALDQLFAPDLLAGGYRKKYHRAVSRLVALAREGERLERGLAVSPRNHR